MLCIVNVYFYDLFHTVKLFNVIILFYLSLKGTHKIFTLNVFLNDIDIIFNYFPAERHIWGVQPAPKILAPL